MNQEDVYGDEDREADELDPRGKYLDPLLNIEKLEFHHMDAETGKLYESVAEAEAAGVKPENIVEISGPPAAIRKVSKAVNKATLKNRRIKRNKALKQQKESRRRNRR